MDGSVLEEKSSFKMLGWTLSSKFDWGSYIISISKTASKKIRALIHSMKFLSPEVALYLYNSTTHLRMEYCCNIWAGVPSCYLELLDKLQKRIYRTVGPHGRHHRPHPPQTLIWGDLVNLMKFMRWELENFYFEGGAFSFGKGGG